MSFGDTMLHVMLLPEKMSAIGQLVKYVALLVLFVNYVICHSVTLRYMSCWYSRKSVLLLRYFLL